MTRLTEPKNDNTAMTKFFDLLATICMDRVANRFSNLRHLSVKIVKISLALIIMLNHLSYGQSSSRKWNGKKCAVVLTYDDALDCHLDKVIPLIDSMKFKATFYLIGSSPTLANRMNEWRAAAANGHELGNHSLNHPCDGTLPGRSWVSSKNNLNNYSVERAVNEIRFTNTLLKAIDGKDIRTFAYPCGDRRIRDTLFYSYLENDFAAARGVNQGYSEMKQVDMSNINAFGHAGTAVEAMIKQIEQAEKLGSFVVFLFHGVGGGHSLNTDYSEHKRLLQYLKERESDIWVAPMLEVANYIKKARK